MPERRAGGRRYSACDAGTRLRDDHTPFITVITVVRNGANTIRNTIRSVAQQTFRDFEYLVVDGASTDDTVRVLESETDSIDCWISEPDSGIYSAWNKAVRMARGQWIAFLGADDSYYPTALSDYADAMMSLSNVHYVSSRIDLAKGGEVVRTIGSPWGWPAFSRYMTVAHVGSMHHRSLFEQYGMFDEAYRICGDYELLLRPRDQLRTAFIDRITAQMTLGGISNKNVALALAEQERAKRQTGKRAGWICALERREAHVKVFCRSLFAAR